MAETVRCQLARCPGWHDLAPHQWALKSLYNSRIEKMEGNGDIEENHKEKKKLPLKSECLYVDIETVLVPLEPK